MIATFLVLRPLCYDSTTPLKIGSTQDPIVRVVEL